MAVGSIDEMVGRGSKTFYPSKEKRVASVDSIRLENDSTASDVQDSTYRT